MQLNNNLAQVSNNYSLKNSPNLQFKNQPSFGALRPEAADMFMKKAAAASLDEKGKNIVAEAIQTLAKNISEALIDIGTGKSKTITKTPLGKVQISLRPEIEDVLTIIDAKAPDNQIKAAPFGKILEFEQDGSNVFVKMSDRLSDTQNGAKKLSVQDFVKQLTELVDYKEKTAAKKAANRKIIETVDGEPMFKAVLKGEIEKIEKLAQAKRQAALAASPSARRGRHRY